MPNSSPLDLLPAPYGDTVCHQLGTSQSRTPLRGRAVHLHCGFLSRARSGYLSCLGLGLGPPCSYILTYVIGDGWARSSRSDLKRGILV